MSDKVFKLPRNLIAKMVDNNHQAIKAIENIEQQSTLTLPEQMTVLNQLVELANANAMQASLIANQLLNEQSPYLPPVAYYQEPNIFLDSV